jgi:recombination protein RecR
MLFPPALRQLIQQLERLPGIGARTAQRLALYLIRRPDEEVRRLAESLVQARERTRLCQRCFFLSEGERCEICNDPSREADVICVVADPRDVVALERLEQYRGLYHVLHGLISPAEGVQPEDLKIARANRARACRAAPRGDSGDPCKCGRRCNRAVSRASDQATGSARHAHRLWDARRWRIGLR